MFQISPRHPQPFFLALVLLLVFGSPEDSKAEFQSAPQSCGTKPRTIQEFIGSQGNQIWKAYAVHSKEEQVFLKETLEEQAKQTLCEMVASEVVFSPLGWHGSSNKTHPPQAALDFAQKYGLEEFYTNLRKTVQTSKAKLKENLNEKIINGLPKIALIHRALANARQTGTKNENEISKLQGILEQTLRSELPYSNNPFVRDYYNTLLKQMDQGPVHWDAKDLERRATKFVSSSQSWAETQIWAKMRRSQEAEARSYIEVQNARQKGGIGHFPEEYKKSLGELGVFTGKTENKKTNEALGLLNLRYGNRPTISTEAVEAAAEVGTVFAPPGVGEAYAVASEVYSFKRTYQDCYPSIPTGFRSGVCESLTPVGITRTRADYIGGAPEVENCALKITAQAGMAVAALTVVGGRAVKVLRVLRRSERLVAGVDAVATGKKIENAVARSSTPHLLQTVAEALPETLQISDTATQSITEAKKIERQIASLATPMEYHQKQLVNLNKALSNPAIPDARKTSISDQLQVSKDYLASAKAEIAILNKERERIRESVENELRSHSDRSIANFANNPYQENAHIFDHFLPDRCTQNPTSDLCQQALAEFIKSKRGSKDVTSFFPNDLDIKSLSRNLKNTPPQDTHIVPGHVSEVTYRFRNSKGPIELKVVICQSPGGCSKVIKEGDVISLFPICGAGVFAAKIIETRVVSEPVPCPK